MALLDTFDEAVRTYGHEVERLRFLPETRDNRGVWPVYGGYDWLSGQLLYCLIRQVKPKRVIEISSNCGYSSTFSAMALRENKSGMLETFELSPEFAQSAQVKFETFGLTEYVRMHVGDARETIDTLLQTREKGDLEILFLDSDHTEAFARFYLDALLADTSDESIFHMHDILPPDSRYMYRPPSVNSLSLTIKRAVFKVAKTAQEMVIGDTRSSVYWRSITSAEPYYPSHKSSEAELGHQLSAKIPSKEQVYVSSIVDRYPQLTPHQYDHLSVWRCNANGQPIEWNQSWWVTCQSLKQVYSSKFSG